MKTTHPRCLSLVALGLLVVSVSHAADAPPVKLPAEVERLIRWLPEDTETLVVARSFPLTPLDYTTKVRWSEIGAVHLFTALDSGKRVPMLANRAIRLAVQGSRRYDSVSSFGSLRAEAATVVEFAEEFGTDVADGLRRAADQTRTISGRAVFVFPSTIVKEPWVRLAPWEASYYVVLDSRTLLVATSDRYLSELLARIDQAPTGRALPPSLTEWRHVDIGAPSWMLRHFPRPPGGRGTIGTTTRFTADRFEVVYVPGPDTRPDFDAIDRFWFPNGTTPEQRRKFHLERRPDGAVVFSTTDPPNPDDDLLIWGFQSCSLEALDCFGTW